MTMLNDTEKKLLLAIVAEGERLRALAARPAPYARRWANRMRDARYQIAAQMAKAEGVRLDFGRLLGDSGPAGRQRGRRALVGLEAARLVIRSRSPWGDTRLTHVRLTAAGEALARQLAAAGSGH